ncbi:PilZ domain-containing protein [Allosphingosinicella sp.]|uniref:PilZ domain-containing protein n=1 Tax=Allosphingosinicella sp. TaxID=2823234 RepID=UPI002FC1791C
MATVSSSAEKRSGKRLDVSIPSRLRHGGFDQADVRICNLSFRGFRAECEKPLTRGDFVSIDLPQIGLVRARIAWCQSGYVGGMFLKATDIRRCV